MTQQSFKRGFLKDPPPSPKTILAYTRGEKSSNAVERDVVIL